MSDNGEYLAEESPFMSLPRELVTVVLGRVAASSFIDLYRAKLCCKEFSEIAEEDYILERISMDKFPVVQWHENQRVSKFLNECKRSRNPEALFRKGVVDYFGGKDLETALKCLEDAAKSGHAESSYAIAIILVFCGGESKQKGMALLSGMKKSRIQKRKVKDCRQRLQNIVKMIWVKNSLILSQRPICCTMQHKKKSGWQSDEIDEDDNDNNMCDGCSCDEEIAPICDALPQFAH